MNKRIFSLVLSILIVVLVAPYSFANESELVLEDYTYELENLKAKVVDTYSEFYSIPKIEAKIKSVEEYDAYLKLNVEVFMQKKLKASSANELPYIKGLNHAKNNLNSEDQKHIANERIQDLIADIEQNYIGQLQDEYAYFSMYLAKSNNSRSITSNLDTRIEFLPDFDRAMSLEEFKPANSNALFNKGTVELSNMLKDIDVNE